MEQKQENDAVAFDWVADGKQDGTAEVAEDTGKDQVDPAAQAVEGVPGFNPVFTKRQTIARRTLKREAVKEVLYGGAKGGGKSVFGCYWCFLQAVNIIRKCQVEERTHPIRGCEINCVNGHGNVTLLLKGTYYGQTDTAGKT